MGKTSGRNKPPGERSIAAQLRAKSTDGNDTGFGFTIPSSWPKWKTRCSAHKRSNKEIQCKAWAVRGMPTCRRHGSGGVKNAQLGLVRYLAWIIIGCPKDTPAAYARWIALAAAMEMMFNHGYGTVEQRLRAAQWLLDLEAPPHERARVNKLDMRAIFTGEEPTEAPSTEDS